MGQPETEIVRALLEDARPREALALAGRALAERGDDAALRILRARALLVFRAVAAAERELARALALDPRAGQAYTLLAELALRRHDVAAAAVFLRDARRHAPDDLRTAELVRVVRGWRAAGAAAVARATDTPSTIDRSAA